MKTVARQIPASNNFGTNNSLPLRGIDSANSKNISAAQAASMALQVRFFFKLNAFGVDNVGSKNEAMMVKKNFLFF